MVTLQKRVRREVPAPRRPLIVSLIPGEDPLVEVREKGRRTGFAVTVPALYQILAKRASDNAVAERQRERRMKRDAARAARKERRR